MNTELLGINPEKFKDVQQFGGFDRVKKCKFLELYLKNPDYSGCAKVLGVTRQTVWYSMEQDPEFKAAFQSVKEELCDQLEERVYTFGQRPQGFMDRIAFLRSYRPSRWAPDKHMSVTVDVKQTESLSTKATEYIDTTAVESPTERVITTDGESRT